MKYTSINGCCVAGYLHDIGSAHGVPTFASRDALAERLLNIGYGDHTIVFLNSEQSQEKKWLKSLGFKVVYDGVEWDEDYSDEGSGVCLLHGRQEVINQKLAEIRKKKEERYKAEKEKRRLEQLERLRIQAEQQAEKLKELRQNPPEIKKIETRALAGHFHNFARDHGKGNRPHYPWSHFIKEAWNLEVDTKKYDYEASTAYDQTQGWTSIAATLAKMVNDAIEKRDRKAERPAPKPKTIRATSTTATTISNSFFQKAARRR